MHRRRDPGSKMAKAEAMEVQTQSSSRSHRSQVTQAQRGGAPVDPRGEQHGLADAGTSGDQGAGQLQCGIKPAQEVRPLDQGRRRRWSGKLSVTAGLEPYMMTG